MLIPLSCIGFILSLFSVSSLLFHFCITFFFLLRSFYLLLLSSSLSSSSLCLLSSAFSALGSVLVHFLGRLLAVAGPDYRLLGRVLAGSIASLRPDFGRLSVTSWPCFSYRPSFMSFIHNAKTSCELEPYPSLWTLAFQTSPSSCYYNSR